MTPPAEVIRMPDRGSTPEERAAMEGRATYARRPIDWEVREEQGEPPPRSWAIEHWLGMDYITLLSGLGGVGKSVVAQQIATAVALGKPFIGNVFAPRTVLMWAGEDDEDEIDRRAISICSKFGATRLALRGRLLAHSMHDVDCTLIDVIQGQLARTSMLTELRAQIGDYGADVVVLDNIAKMYGGSENDRHQVSAFMTALTWAAKPTRAAVLLLGHVSKGIGSEYSGSTAWENACRARLWFTDKPPDQKDSDAPDDGEPATDLRYLAKRKVNYTARDLVTMKYTDGAYDVISGGEMSAGNGSGDLVSSIRANNARQAVLAGLQRLETMGLYGNESTGSPTFLPKMLAQFGMAEQFSRQDLAKATRALMADGSIVRAVVGKYPNRTDRFGLKLHK